MNAPDRRAHFIENEEPLKPLPANQLPPAARDLLILASQVRDPGERRVAIDRAIDVAKARYPELFQPHP